MTWGWPQPTESLEDPCLSFQDPKHLFSLLTAWAPWPAASRLASPLLSGAPALPGAWRPRLLELQPK